MVSVNESATIQNWDLLVVGLYFLLMLATGIYSSCRPNRDTVAGYFLAGRYMSWFPIGASLFASNIGSEHFIGLAGSGAAGGIFVGAFELNALILLQFLGWVFLPVFVASGVNTLPEYMSKRFGRKRIRTCLAAFSLLLYLLTKISVNLYCGSIFIQQAFQWTNLYISVSILVVLTAFLTIAGGLSAVIYTDTLQFFIMISGSLYVAVKAFSSVGSYANLRTEYLKAIPDKILSNSTCGLPPVESWVMLRDANDPDMPWPGFILGQTPASIWYWCADQMMVQRVLAAKSISHAQGATIFAGFTKLLPLFLIVMPGMISRVLFPNEVGCADPIECQKFCGAKSCTNFAYPKLVFSYMPSGLRGLMLSVMLSALISDLTSIFNSSSTLFTMDIWVLLRSRASEREKLLVGRAFNLVLVVVSILWIPIIEETQGGELYMYIQKIAAHLSPQIAAIYCLAIFWTGTNEAGAFWGLLSGFLVGVIRMTFDFSFPEPPCYLEDTRPAAIRKLHFMYFAVLLFWFTIFMAVVISKCTKPLPKGMLTRTTYWTVYDQCDQDPDSERRKKLLSPITEIKELDCEAIELSQVDAVSGNFLKAKEKSSKAKDDEEKMNLHIAQLTNLHQERWEKLVLNTMLVAIVMVALSLYIYFSINPFTEEEIHKMQSEKLTEILRKKTNETFWLDEL